ncbi:MAG: 1-deoxy-D-xylulose-5-phosphate synthase [Candidatus Omnitrophica bacterium]|nr:1-deoxy-D-xylulose-5-phosphate synthase [Candidatus Omnitrophota bacterium]MDD5671379.1 1-deoxy-D-xylulose-5-phosphate synthase [Candidatus Omnitrophota bacterium]
MSKWIDKINSPEDLKRVSLAQLPKVAEEYREHLIDCVSKTGGHLGASLGALDLNIALHYVLNSPQDKICWDVGHQAYVHKMITGRKDRMPTLRQGNGLSGFPSPFESPHDSFIVGHAGTAISQALGLACARDFKKGKERVVAVVGDGALTAGLSFEALNNAGQLKKDMLIILNDNEMSISKNVGAISKYLNKVLTNPLYNRIRADVEKQLEKFPRLRRLANFSLESMKHLFVPGIIFEELGFRYFGPVDGHDIVGLVGTLNKVLSLHECCLLHVITKKGKGCDWAEKDAEKLHGVTPFNVRTGEKIKSPVELEKEKEEGILYTDAFANALLHLAEKDPRIVAVTAAMPSGTGLLKFQEKFPERFFDVGIAEQHAVTFAGALATGGMKPVCAIYSTFLQRAYDQLIHDVALQRQNVVFGIDRAGIVGADGATHNGVFDIGYLGSIPHAVIGAPKDEYEMEHMLKLALNCPNLFALRYPRGHIPKMYSSLSPQPFDIGEGEILKDGQDVTLLALGSTVEIALKAHELLKHEGVDAQVINMRFASPLDERMLCTAASKRRLIFTLEEHVLSGGFGSRVLEWYEQHDLSPERVRRLALPDEFIEHGLRETLLDRCGLSPEKVTQRVLSEIRMKDIASGTL